jgi:hypothetical protein
VTAPVAEVTCTRDAITALDDEMTAPRDELTSPLAEVIPPDDCLTATNLHATATNLHAIPTNMNATALLQWSTSLSHSLGGIQAYRAGQHAAVTAPRRDYRRAIVTPPFVVVARIIGPPAPSCVVMRRSRLPDTVPCSVTGKPRFMWPLTVPVSRFAE